MEIQGPYDPNRVRLIKQRESDLARGRDAAASDDGDRLEISDVGKLLNSIDQLPDIRQERIAQIREEIEAGTYVTDDKLRDAIRNFLDDTI